MATYLREIPALKYLLALGVVVIHLFLPVDISQLPATAANSIIVWNNFRNLFAAPCLWTFFVLSGMLYFHNTEKLTKAVYLRKTKSRVSTLLVPYLLWNLMGCGVFLIKVYVFGAPGFDIVADGHINFLKLIQGFWAIVNEYPYDPSLWFIRDLFIISLLSPVIYLLARYPLLLIAAGATVIYLYPGFYNRYAFIYFAFGAWLAMHPEILRGKAGRRTLRYAGILWLILAVTRTLYPDAALQAYYFQEVPASCAFAVIVIALARKVPERFLSRFNRLYPSAFFVFALHCFYTGAVKKIFISLIGLDSGWAVAGVVVLSFITVMAVTTFIYVLCRRLSPRLTALLSGGRS